MSTDRKSIAQIKKEFAEAKEGSLEELFAQYAMDERSGVKAVLNSFDLFVPPTHMMFLIKLCRWIGDDPNLRIASICAALP